MIEVKMNLEDLGWGEPHISAFEELDLPRSVPGRVVWRSLNHYRVQSDSAVERAEPTGKVWEMDPPAVGDWVALLPGQTGRGAVILSVLPRKSAFSRNAAGKAVDRQVLAANVDEVFIVCGLDGDFNLRRIERYVTLAYIGGARPVVILNKADLSPNAGDAVRETQSVSPGLPVYPLSALASEGLQQLSPHLGRGQTVVFLGSSGAGKSTLINRLLEEDRIRVAGVRGRDSKGRHTTTHRELFLLPGGAAVIDTPGLRELQVWGEGEGLSEAFPEIEDLARRCRFRDCRHESEAGCAVRQSVESGLLDAKRFGSYRKLRDEFESHRLRHGVKARIEEKRRGRRMAKMIREINRHNPKRRR